MEKESFADDLSQMVVSETNPSHSNGVQPAVGSLVTGDVHDRSQVLVCRRR